MNTQFPNIPPPISTIIKTENKQEQITQPQPPMELKQVSPPITLEQRIAIYKPIIETCRNYLVSTILENSYGKIISRTSQGKTFARLLNFSVKVEPGKLYMVNAYIKYDDNNKICQVVNFRPGYHPSKIWYFPIFYLYTGVCRLEWKDFKSLELISGEKLLNDMVQPNGYNIYTCPDAKISGIKNICISWGNNSYIPNTPTTSNTPSNTTTTQPVSSSTTTTTTTTSNSSEKPKIISIKIKETPQETTKETHTSQ